MSRRCGSCVWWSRNESGLVKGECRRHPPYVVNLEVFEPSYDKDTPGTTSIKTVTRWPTTEIEDFCGEFKDAYYL